MALFHFLWLVLVALDRFIAELHPGGGNSYDPEQNPISFGMSLGREIFDDLFALLSINKPFPVHYALTNTQYQNPATFIDYRLLWKIKFGLEYRL